MQKLIRSIVMAFIVMLAVFVVPAVLIIGYLVKFREMQFSFANYELMIALYGGIFVILFFAYFFKGRK